MICCWCCCACVCFSIRKACCSCWWATISANNSCFSLSACKRFSSSAILFVSNSFFAILPSSINYFNTVDFLLIGLFACLSIAWVLTSVICCLSSFAVFSFSSSCLAKVVAASRDLSYMSRKICSSSSYSASIPEALISSFSFFRNLSISLSYCVRTPRCGQSRTWNSSIIKADRPRFSMLCEAVRGCAYLLRLCDHYNTVS